MNRKLLGPLMADVGGLGLTADDRDVLQHPLVGGVILFKRNYADRAQLKRLCDQILSLRRPRLLLAVDYEGGRVQRFRDGFTILPAVRELGRAYETDAAAARRRARAHGATIARELGEFGIDLCFAPVLDLDHGLSQVIGDRAFSDRIAAVVSLAKAFVAGLKQGGMAATAKHFPGHGAVVPDSHVELPVDERSLDEIERTDLKPFRALVEAGVPSLMVAHVRYPAFDAQPASLSRKWVGAYLRRRLRYRGAVFTDDLSMGGAAAVGSVQERAWRALEAGCDMLPVCNDRPAVLELLDDLRDVKPRRAASARLQSLYLRGPT